MITRRTLFALPFALTGIAPVTPPTPQVSQFTDTMRIYNLETIRALNRKTSFSVFASAEERLQQALMNSALDEAGLTWIRDEPNKPL